MAEGAVILPFSHDPELLAWLRESGVPDLPVVAGLPLAPADVRQILDDSDWPYREAEREHEGSRITNFTCERRGDAWPPFTEVDVWPDFVAVRHGGYPAYVIAVGAAARVGPQVVTHDSGGGPAVVTAETTYEQFSRASGYQGDLHRDSAWSR